MMHLYFLAVEKKLKPIYKGGKNKGIISYLIQM